MEILSSWATSFTFLPEFQGKVWILLVSCFSMVFGLISSLRFLLLGIFSSSPTSKLIKADNLAREKNWDGAKEIFIEMGSFGKAAEMAYKNKKPEEALELALQSKDFVLQGTLLALFKKHTEAAQAFDLGRKTAEAADQWEKSGNLEKALERYRLIGHARKVQMILDKLGHYEDLALSYADECQKLRALMGPNPSQSQVQNATIIAQRAMETFEKGKNYEAGYEFALRVGQTLKAAQFVEKLGNAQRAADLYKQANKIDEAARVLLEAKEYDKAIELYDELDRIDEIPPILEKAGRIQEAQAIRAKMALVGGKLAEASKFYEAADMLKEAAEYAEQAKDLKRAACLFENLGDFAKAGEMFEKQGELEKALLCFEKAKVFFRLGKLRENQGDMDGAIRAYQNVSLKDPFYPNTSHALARLFWKKGMAELSEQHFKGLIQKRIPTKQTVELFYDYACFLEGTGKVSEAALLVDQLLSVDFHFKDLIARKKGLEKRSKSQSGGVKTAAQTHETTKNASSPDNQIADRYEIRTKIGSGGMGAVYLGYDHKLGREVALKILSPNLISSATEEKNIFEEAKVAGKLSHPNIVSMFDVGSSKGNVFMVMEYVKGSDLRKILEKKGPFSIAEVIHIGKQVALALDFAHSAKVVHRDIKSANILLTPQNVVKIADFGLARVMKNAQLIATRSIGSPYYMAPEQILGNPYDHRVDLYSFGAVLYELLTGQPPFLDGEVTYHHIHTAAKKPSTLRKDIPESFENLILKMLEKKPDDRVSSAKEVQLQLNQITG